MLWVAEIAQSFEAQRRTRQPNLALVFNVYFVLAFSLGLLVCICFRCVSFIFFSAVLSD